VAIGYAVVAAICLGMPAYHAPASMPLAGEAAADD
jgi:hypothetical protein